MHPSPGGPSFADLLADRSATAERFLTLKPRGDIGDVHDYWLRGGYPEPWLKPAARFRATWMSQYIKTYVERDIGRLFPGLDQDRFRLFLQHLASLSGTIINNADVARGLGVSPPTVRDYFEIAHGTFLWRRLPPYVKQATKRLVKHAKGHMRDSGLLHRLLHLADRDALLGQPQADRSWEAMVTGEILRQLEWRGLDCEAPRKAARARRGCRETVRRRDGSVRTRYRTLADVLGECRSAPRSHVFLMNPASAAHASQRSRAVLEG